MRPRLSRIDAIMPRQSFLFSVALGTLLVALVGCGGTTGDSDGGSAEPIVMNSRADSVAMKVYEFFGGPEAWAALPALRFDFAGGTETTRDLRARHLWDRTTGDYRVEMLQGSDTVYVALFNVNTREGSVYLNGSPLDSAQSAEMLQNAYRRFINDTYWLLMPVKLFDAGVTRSYLEDSSDSDTDVLQLSFDDVGLTPGDHYWVYVDAETGRVNQWAFRLQHHPPDHVPQPIQWTGYRTIPTAAGDIVVAERKVSPGSVLYTDNVDVPSVLPEGAFTDPNPILDGSS